MNREKILRPDVKEEPEARRKLLAGGTRERQESKKKNEKETKPVKEKIK